MVFVIKLASVGSCLRSRLMISFVVETAANGRFSQSKMDVYVGEWKSL